MSKAELNELRRRMNRSMSRVLNLLRTKENLDAGSSGPGLQGPHPGAQEAAPSTTQHPTGDHAAEATGGAAAVSTDRLHDAAGPSEELTRSGASSPTLPALRNSPPPTPPQSPPPSPPRTRNRWEIEALAEAMPQLEEILEGADYEEVESVRVVVKRPLAGWLLVGRPPASPYQPCGYDGEVMVSYGVFVIRWVGVDLWLLGECEGEDVERELQFGRAVRAVGAA